MAERVHQPKPKGMCTDTDQQPFDRARSLAVWYTSLKDFDDPLLTKIQTLLSLQLDLEGEPTRHHHRSTPNTSVSMKERYALCTQTCAVHLHVVQGWSFTRYSSCTVQAHLLEGGVDDEMPDMHLMPKVMAPFETKPGDTPRRLQIQR
jgi:hypothetical protein